MSHHLSLAPAMPATTLAWRVTSCCRSTAANREYRTDSVVESFGSACKYGTDRTAAPFNIRVESSLSIVAPTTGSHSLTLQMTTRYRQSRRGSDSVSLYMLY